jgi:hypothetical protein
MQRHTDPQRQVSRRVERGRGQKPLQITVAPAWHDAAFQRRAMHQQAEESGTGMLPVHLGRREYDLTGFWDKGGHSKHDSAF